MNLFIVEDSPGSSFVCINVNTIKTSAITRYIAINIPFTIPILFIPPNGLSHNYLCIVT